MRCEEVYFETYGRAPDAVAFCPYRISPLGAHIDHQYVEKPREPKGNLAVPPFYYYRATDIHRIQDALDAGCGYDAPGSFAAWLSIQTPMHAFIMPGKRYDIGDMKSYQYVQEMYKGITQLNRGEGAHTAVADGSAGRAKLGWKKEREFK